MQLLAFLGVFFSVLASGLILVLGGYFHHAHRDRVDLIGLALLAGFASTTISVFFNVALASVADEALEGRRLELREALAESVKCIGPILAWSAIAVIVGVILNQLARRIPLGGRLVAWLAGTAWSLATIFVVPVLALEGGGAVPAIRRSAGLFKDRWGEGISGNVAIGAWAILVTIPAALAICIGLRVPSAGVGALLVTGGVVSIVAVWVMSSAAREVFAVALYRYATDDSTGSFSAGDLAEPFDVRKAAKNSRIWGWIAVVISAFVLLAIVGRVAGVHRTTSGTSQTQVGLYNSTIPERYRQVVRPGTRVYFFSRVVGEVTSTDDTGNGLYVHMAIEPGVMEGAIGSRTGSMNVQASPGDPNGARIVIAGSGG